MDEGLDKNMRTEAWGGRRCGTRAGRFEDSGSGPGSTCRSSTHRVELLNSV